MAWPKRTSVGTEPHLLQVELLHTCLIGGDGGALHTNRVLEDGLSGIGGDLVVGLIPVLESLQHFHQRSRQRLVLGDDRHARS